MPVLLLVDDIQGIHDMLDLVFEGTDIELRHALLAQQAIEIYQSGEVDVVLSDICMPGMDGLQLLSALRKIDPAVTMIMTTAAEDRNYVIQALRLGAYDYIEKPYDEGDLQKRVAQALNERKKRLDSGQGASTDEVEQLKRELARRDEAIAEARASIRPERRIDQLTRSQMRAQDKVRLSTSGRSRPLVSLRVG